MFNYIDSTFINTVITDNISLYNFLDDVLNEKLPSFKPDAVNGNVLTFNKNIGYSEETTLLISDGIKSVKTKLTKIDSNNFSSNESLSDLNHLNIVINYIGSEGWSFKREGNNLFISNLRSADNSIVFYDNQNGYRFYLNGKGHGFGSKIYSFPIVNWKLLYTSNCFLFCYEYAGSWYFLNYYNVDNNALIVSNYDLRHYAVNSHQETKNQTDFSVTTQYIKDRSTSIVPITCFGYAFNLFGFSHGSTAYQKGLNRLKINDKNTAYFTFGVSSGEMWMLIFGFKV